MSLFKALAGDRVVVVAAHHAGVAEVADQVLFFEDGRLAEQGDHSSLVRSSSAYARHWHALPQQLTAAAVVDKA